MYHKARGMLFNRHNALTYHIKKGQTTKQEDRKSVKVDIDFFEKANHSLESVFSFFGIPKATTFSLRTTGSAGVSHGDDDGLTAMSNQKLLTLDSQKPPPAGCIKVPEVCVITEYDSCLCRRIISLQMLLTTLLFPIITRHRWIMNLSLVLLKVIARTSVLDLQHFFLSERPVARWHRPRYAEPTLYCRVCPL
jgi:hypothetical protein